MIGAFPLDIFSFDILSVSHLDLQLAELSLIPAEQVENLPPAWLEAGQTKLSTQSILSPRKRYAMSAFGRHACCFQTSRSSAYDEHAFWPFGRAEPVASPFPFATGRWVDDAADPVIPRAAPPAHLVAG